MEGFVITINEKKETFAVKKGMVLITILHNFEIEVIGADDTTGISLNWGKFRITNRDKVIIEELGRIIKVNKPVATSTIDRSELVMEYLELKDLLLKKGLI